MPEVSEWLMILSSDVLRNHLSEFSLKILAKANHFLRTIRAKPPVDCNSFKKKKKVCIPRFYIISHREFTSTCSIFILSTAKNAFLWLSKGFLYFTLFKWKLNAQDTEWNYLRWNKRFFIFVNALIDYIVCSAYGLVHLHGFCFLSLRCELSLHFVGSISRSVGCEPSP